MTSKVSLLAVGDLVFSLPIQVIRHILDAPRIFSLPQIKPLFSGVLLYQDLPIPVLDPGRLWPEIEGRHGPWPLTLLFQVEQGDVALPIDGIHHIVDENSGSWSEADDGVGGHGDRCFLYEENRYPLLTIDALLQHETLKT